MDEPRERYINSVNLNIQTDFPYLVLDVVDDTPSRRNPGFHVMHWHEDLQFIYVRAGGIEVQTLDRAEPVRAGEMMFLNRNVIHRVLRRGSCHYYSFIFPSYFLRFYAGSPAGPIVDAVTGDEDLQTLHIRPETGWEKAILSRCARLADLENEKTSRLYPYEVLVELSAIWLTLCKNADLSRGAKTGPAEARVQKVLRFISQHYAEDLSLDDLARSASVSRSECTRCFRQCMHTTPYQYLVEYRLSKAAELLKDTDLPVGEIAMDVGFRQMSHFGKCFREKTGMTPLAYRRANAG